MVAAVEMHPQGRAKPTEALYRFAIGALVGAALLGPAMLTYGFKTDALDIRLGCAFTCIEITAVPPQAGPPDGPQRAQHDFLRHVAARPADLEITLSLSALSPMLREAVLRASPRDS
jgi:hypothetical protein